MCNKCNNPSCNGCSYTYQNYPCPSFPPPPGPVGPQGPQGPQGLSGVDRENGSFARLANQGSGSFIVSTINEVVMLFLTATELTPSTGSSSQGVGSNLQNSCVANDSGLISIDPNNSIKMLVGGNGYTAVISGIASNSFSVTWSQVGLGTDVLVNWQAIVKV